MNVDSKYIINISKQILYNKQLKILQTVYQDSEVGIINVYYFIMITFKQRIIHSYLRAGD